MGMCIEGCSNNVVFLKQENTYYTKTGRKVHTIKINGQTVFRELDGEVIRDIRDQVKDETAVSIDMTFDEIKKDNKLMETAKKLYQNKKIRKLIVTIGSLIIVYAFYSSLPGPAIPVMAATLEDPAAINTWNEIAEVKSFLNFVINLIRVLVVCVCGLIAANTGMKVATDENVEGQKEAKKAANKILWALFLVFVGTSIAKIIGEKLIRGI